MKKGQLLLEIGDFFQGKDLDEDTNRVYNEQLIQKEQEQEANNNEHKSGEK